MMNEQSIRAFFTAYEKRFNEGITGQVDVDATMQSFTDCFIEASPLGVICGKNDESFKTSIPKGYDFYRSIGTTAMKIADVDINIFDDHHAMAEVFWKSYYTKKDGKREVIDFSVIYLLQHLNDQLKIFAYITGDEQKLLRERGLVPE